MKNRAPLLLTLAILLGSCSQTSKTNKPSESVNKKPMIIGDTVSQLGNNIMVVYQDKKNNYWFGSWETGIYRYDGKNIINYNTKHGLKYNRIDEIKEDNFGNIYFNTCSLSSVITKFDGKEFIQLTPTPSNDWKLLNDDLWFKPSGYSESIYRFDGIILHLLKLPKPPKISNAFEIYSIYKDKKGHVWFGSNPVGVCRYNGKAFDWITEGDVTELHNGPANGVRSIIEDKEGYFWFNSGFRYKVSDSAAIKGKPFYERQKSIGNLDGKSNSDLNEYLSIAKDDNDNLWIATYRNGVWKYDGNKTKHYAIKENGKEINLFYIYKDNLGNIWLGTHENGVFKFNGETFSKFLR